MPAHPCNDGAPTGYLHPGYAASLAGFGTPRLLPRSGAWILERRIPQGPYRDGMGCYPLLLCRTWTGLREDLDDLGDGLGGALVTLAVVTDPFGAFPSEAYLRACFRDVVRPYKAHFVVDLQHPPDRTVSPHHRRNVRSALARVRVERCSEPVRFLETWLNLYDVLVRRHRIRGISAFSPEAFDRQLRVPGLEMFRAVHGDQTVGILLWYVQEDRAYYHLGAYSPEGYALKASFALFWEAIRYFAAAGLRWLNLGAGAGVQPGGVDGLARFKRGWATGTRTAYFCGRVFDPGAYARLSGEATASTGYFPAYRAGEFN